MVKHPGKIAFKNSCFSSIIATKGVLEANKGNSVDYGARVYDSRLGKWLSPEPLFMKYPMLSPYAYSANNPIRFVDVDGRDWFVNTKDGTVIYLKNEKQVSKELFESLKFNNQNPNDYERMGPNEMFGAKVDEGTLNRDFVILYEGDMKSMGYNKAEKVIIMEAEYVSGGRMGPGENISLTVPVLEQIGDSKITYVEPEKLNSKEVVKESAAKSNWSSSRCIIYKLIKPFGQDNKKTAEYYSNRSMDLNTGIGILDNAIQIAKAIFGKK